LAYPIAIHIVTYNCAKTIATCLHSLAHQTFTDFTLYIIDNASTDNTVQIIHQLGYTTHVNAQNMGYSFAHNQALVKTNSQYVLTLNPDVWLDPLFLESMYKRMEATKELGSVAGCLLRVDSLGDTATRIDSMGVQIYRTRRQYLINDNLSVICMKTFPTRIFGPDGAAAFYRRDMLNDIAVNEEIFDNIFFLHKEDIDICWRAQLRGWSSEYVHDAVAHHIRTFRPGKRRNVEKWIRYYAVRNRYILILKNDIRLHYIMDLPFILIYEIIIFVYICLLEPSSLRAYISVIKHLPQIMSKRKIIQSRRKVSVHEISERFTRG
jgi:GT2 family glycosyltransferase